MLRLQRKSTPMVITCADPFKCPTQKVARPLEILGDLFHFKVSLKVDRVRRGEIRPDHVNHVTIYIRALRGLVLIKQGQTLQDLVE